MASRWRRRHCRRCADDDGIEHRDRSSLQSVSVAIGASSNQNWDQRSIDHLIAAGKFACDQRAVEGTALDVTMSLPEAGGAVLQDYAVQVSRPTFVPADASGDTIVKLKYLDGPVIFTDAFASSYSYNGVVYPDVDYSGIHYSSIERRIRVPVSFDPATPRPTTMEVIRSGNTVFRGTIFGRPPVVNGIAAQTVECTGNLSATVTLDGSGASDPDGDLLQISWTGPFGTASGASPTETFPLGTSTVGVAVTDGVFPAVSVQTEVTVQDTQPPLLLVAPSPSCLWPPNHSMVLFTLADVGVQASDSCDPAPDVRIVAANSDQTAQSSGSGNTATDVVFGSGAVCVRAERDGSGNADRTYHVIVQATDAAGNVTSRDAIILVPHDQGQASCATVDPSRVVPDGDPRCLAAAPAAQRPAPFGTVAPSPAAATAPRPQTSGGAGGCSLAGSAATSMPALFYLILLFAVVRRFRHC